MDMEEVTTLRFHKAGNLCAIDEGLILKVIVDRLRRAHRLTCKKLEAEVITDIGQSSAGLRVNRRHRKRKAKAKGRGNGVRDGMWSCRKGGNTEDDGQNRQRADFTVPNGHT